MTPHDKAVLEVLSDANYVVVTEYRPSWKSNGKNVYADFCSLTITNRMMLGDAKKYSDDKIDEKDFTHWVAHYKSKWNKV